MTTLDKAEFHINEEVFQAFIKNPGIAKHIGKIRDDIKSSMMAAWPRSIGFDVAADTKNFTHEKHTKIFVAVDNKWKDGRPVAYALVNHPHAVAHQAKTGFVTKSVKAAGFNMSGWEKKSG